MGLRALGFELEFWRGLELIGISGLKCSVPGLNF